MDRLNSRGIEDETIERAFVASLVQKPEMINKVVSSLPEEALVEPDCQAVYLGLMSLSSKRPDVSEIALCHELRGLNLYKEAGERAGVESFYKHTKIGNSIALGQMVLDMHSRRLEIELADMIHARAHDPSFRNDNDMAGRHSAIMAGLQGIQRLSFADGRSISSDEFGSYYRRLLQRRLADINKPKMKFRWSEFNPYTPALVDGDLVAIVAESGSGKTSFMEDQAEFLWKQGYHGVFYHFELSTNKMADRRVARGTGIPYRILQDGREQGDVYAFLNDRELQSIDETIALQDTWPGSLTLRHCPGWTWEQLCGDIRIRAQEGDLDFVVVDYFNKVQVRPNRGSYLTYEIGRGLELFNTTLEDLWVTGFIAAQFDKSIKRSKSKLKSVADARDSAELDDKSNVGMYLHRPRDADTGRRVSTVEVYITKCNAGVSGMESLYFDGGRFRFRSLMRNGDDFTEFIS